ncbi:MAG: translocation/assembly module TamB domain-containing protein [Halioglobus sp.]|nr:translocation/assembly module TamB domain-containing protein [Halioglobus sp.]
MIARGARYLLTLLAGLALAVFVAAMWLLHTESGAAWLWARATAALPGQLSATSLKGSVGGGLEFEELEFRHPATKVRIHRLAFTANLDLLPLQLTIQGLRAGGVTVRLLPSSAEPSGEPSPSLREVFKALRLPLAVSVRDLDIRDASVVDAGGGEFRINELQMDGALYDELLVEQLSLKSPLLQAEVSGSLGLAEPFPLLADVAARSGLPIEDDHKEPLAAALKLHGNLGRLELLLSSTTHDVHASGTVDDVDVDPAFDLDVNASDLRWPFGAAQPMISLQQMSARLSGGVDDYGMEFDAALEAEATGPFSANGSLCGNLRGLQFERLALHSADADAGLTGKLNWSKGFSAAANVDLLRLDPGRWLSGWPEAQTVSGAIDATLAGARLEIASMGIRHDGNAARVNGRGVIDLDGGIVDAELGWTDLQWPLAPVNASIDSRSANLTVSGTPDNWILSGDIAISAPDVPEGSFNLNGKGNQDGLTVVVNDSEVLGGSVTGKLAYSWVREHAFSAGLDASNLRTAALMANFPGRINGRFSASGQRVPFSLNLNIERLSGELQNRPVTASGRIGIDAGHVRAERLQLASGQSSLQLNGDWLDEDGLRFVVDVESLADFVPAAAGSVQGAGSVVAGTDFPLLDFELTGREIRWQEFLAERIEVKNVPSSPAAPLGLSASLKNVVSGGRLLDLASLEVRGRPQDHELTATFSASDFQDALGLHGGLSDWQELANSRWTGGLGSLSLQGADELSLSLREPARLDLARDELSLDESCIEVASGGSVCVGGEWSAHGGYRAAFKLQSLPLDLLRMVNASGLEFSQLLDGKLEVSTGPNGRVSGTGRIDLTPGSIRNEFDERLTLRTRAGFAAFELDDGQLLSAEIKLPFSDAAEVHGEFRVLDIGLGQQSPVEGRLTANIRDIGVGAQIIPLIDEASGQLQADIRAGGLLSAPQFSGGFTLENGTFVYDPLGLRIEEIQMTSEILPGNRIELHSEFKAGDGHGKLSSAADCLQGRSAGLEFALTGSRLTLVKLDDLNVVIDPDIKLGLRNNDVSINGRIVVPAARLASVNLINNGENESDDVVFVGEQLPPDAEQSADNSPLQFSGSVELELGDSVTVDLDVAEARLRGKTSFTWQGPALPVASGAFDVAGRFEAYGQLLEISEGTIRFPNVAANNPVLRVRAERDIFGNSQIRRAGVMVTGTAKRPKLEVYTNPPTNQDRALTLLVTGSDFNFEQGVGAVDVGTYIAPRLYASYGIGLFDKDNVISVRYDLARGFGIKASSGKRAAGVDISYTIER